MILGGVQLYSVLVWFQWENTRKLPNGRPLSHDVRDIIKVMVGPPPLKDTNNAIKVSSGDPMRV